MAWSNIKFAQTVNINVIKGLCFLTKFGKEESFLEIDLTQPP